MSERLRENYFLTVRMVITFLLEAYLILTADSLTGVSHWVLLLCALFISLNIVNSTDKRKFLLLPLEGGIILGLCFFGGKGFVLLLAILILDIVVDFALSAKWYFSPMLVLFFTNQSSIMPDLIIILFFSFIYFQQYVVISSYRKQVKESFSSEINLKKDISRQEDAYRESLHKNILEIENSVLEERASLSQALHDKLGHSINGSVYQLEACKVILHKDEKESERILQAVIDNLRQSMDEIRSILRKERPEKYKLAMLQLNSLCDDCKEKGIEANLLTQGDIQKIPERYLEIILDNAYEAVSNAWKYSGCTKITIEIYLLNQMVRAVIQDNGHGCRELTDGMGLSGMRRRMREAGGILDFETEAGFGVKMLFPLQEDVNG